MLPLKWKIFHAVNYFAIFSYLCFIAAFTYDSLNKLLSTVDLLIFILFMLIFAMSITNCIVNVYTLQSCYPDQLPAKPMRRFMAVCSTSNLVLTILNTLLFFIAVGTFLITHRNDWLFLILYITLLGLSWYVQLSQMALRKLIRKNYVYTIESFLDSTTTL